MNQKDYQISLVLEWFSPIPLPHTHIHTQMTELIHNIFLSHIRYKHVKYITQPVEPSLEVGTSGFSAAQRLPSAFHRAQASSPAAQHTPVFTNTLCLVWIPINYCSRLLILRFM